jgi:T5orf172 domain-containing protein
MGVVYVLTNSSMPGLIKIGCTESDDAGTRIAQLYTTGVPVPFKIEFAARVPDILAVESALHQAFAPNRINPKREFFRLEPDQPIAILKLLHVEDATSEVSSVTDAATDDQSKAAAEQQRTRRPRFNFDEMGIPVGSRLDSTHNDAFVIVASARRVRFGDDEVSLTAATRHVLGNDYDVAPGPHWTFDGKLLQDIYEETYPEVT